MDSKWTQSGLTKWTQIGLKLNSNWTQNGLKKDSEWTQEGLRMDSKWSQIGLKTDSNLELKWTENLQIGPKMLFLLCHQMQTQFRKQKDYEF